MQTQGRETPPEHLRKGEMHHETFQEARSPVSGGGPAAARMSMETILDASTWQNSNGKF